MEEITLYEHDWLAYHCKLKSVGKRKRDRSEGKKEATHLFWDLTDDQQLKLNILRRKRFFLQQYFSSKNWIFSKEKVISGLSSRWTPCFPHFSSCTGISQIGEEGPENCGNYLRNKTGKYERGCFISLNSSQFSFDRYFDRFLSRLSLSGSKGRW